MQVITLGRIVSSSIFGRSPRASYRVVRNKVKQFAGLTKPSNLRFAKHVAKDHLRFLINSVHPIEQDTSRRIRAAVDWLLQAQKATNDSGVSYGYFPCLSKGGWRDSYPETTGYIISSLITVFKYFGDERARPAAIQMADWEIEVQMSSGAIQGGILCQPEKQVPAAFNTGMVLDGWISTYLLTGEKRFLDAGRGAADFLVRDLDGEGYFQAQADFMPCSPIKTYTCLCAWPLFRFAEVSGERGYKDAAVRAIDAALRQQQSNGWFANNCLSRPEAPLLHTIGYTLQGILEVGILAGRDDFVEKVRRGVNPILEKMLPDGFLNGRFFADWEPASFSSCLTGSAQIAVVCYRLFAHTGIECYRSAADRIVNYLKALQKMDSSYPQIKGAIPGSFPLFGEYMSSGYPNWATKYFLDSLILQEQLNNTKVPKHNLQSPLSHQSRTSLGKREIVSKF